MIKRMKPVISIDELIDKLEKINRGTLTLKEDPDALIHVEIIASYMKERGLEPTLQDIIDWLKEARREHPDVNFCVYKLRVLTGRPDFETATHYGAAFLYEYVNKYAEEKGFEIIDLFKGDAVREKFIEVLSKNNISFISWCGHGNTDVLTGQLYSRILKVGDTETAELLRRANVVGISALSCLTFAELGRWLVENKYVKWYHGYEREFIFVVSRKEPPTEDQYARPFFDAHFTFDRVILSGGKPSEAYKEAQEKFTKYINDPNVPQVCKPYLRWDMKYEKWTGADKPITGEPKKYICPWCGFETEDRDTIILHIVDKHFLYKCPWCGLETNSADIMINHILKEHCPKKPEYKCPWCGFETQGADEMKKHILDSHIDMCKYYINGKCVMKPCKLRYFIRYLLGCPLAKHWNS